MNYLTVVLNNGKEFDVAGETINDVPVTVGHYVGWSAFEMLNGKTLQVRSESIEAIYECEY